MTKQKKNTTNQREMMKKDLLSQLEERGMVQAYYISLVDDYLRMWDVKNALLDNIEEKGVTIIYDNGGGQRGEKKNDCVPELSKINGQMLKLLNELGLRGADVKPAKKEFEL